MPRRILIIIASSAPLCSWAGTCTVTSQPMIVPVIELFTSEGCSSCPPADRWLSDLRRAERAARPFTALAYHVTYWDYIGWKDRFAHELHGAIHQERVARASRPIRYTPQVFIDGQLFENWQHGRMPGEARQATVSMSLTMAPQPDNRWQFTLHTTGDLESAATVTLALVEHDLQTVVEAGENAGEILTHDYVVRSLTTRPYPAGHEDLTLVLALPVDARPSNSAVVAVLRNANLGTIQSLSAALCR